jgi:hypothetical protein
MPGAAQAFASDKTLPLITYDGENRIKTTAGVTYTYDGDGNRVKKSSGKLYWYGSGSVILDESDATGNITNEYIFFGGKRLARREGSRWVGRGKPPNDLN